MRRLQLLSGILFVIAAISFAVFQIRVNMAADQTGPEIIMEEEQITVSVGADEAELLAGIRAVDERDGDVSASLIVESLSNFTADNTRLLTFAASDADGHIVKGTREIVYEDYQPPRFTLQAPLRFQTGTADLLAVLGAEDVLDGDLSSKIKISSSYSFSANEPGDYMMEFSVVNSAGDVSRLPVTVTVYSPSEAFDAPVIELSEYLIYLSPGEEFDPWDYVERITLGGAVFSREGARLRLETAGETEEDGEDGGWEEVDSGLSLTSIDSSDVRIRSGVDRQTPGVYEITYQFTQDGYGTGMVRLVVVVSD